MAVKGAVKERSRTDLKEPKQYKVIMHNDDFTTMEFVVDILIDVFRKNPSDAEKIMLAVHEKGKAVVGKYPRDIANTRIMESMRRAKAQGFPFKMTMEED